MFTRLSNLLFPCFNIVVTTKKSHAYTTCPRTRTILRLGLKYVLIIIHSPGCKVCGVNMVSVVCDESITRLARWQVYFSTGKDSCFNMVRLFAAYLSVTYKFSWTTGCSRFLFIIFSVLRSLPKCMSILTGKCFMSL